MISNKFSQHWWAHEITRRAACGPRAVGWTALLYSFRDVSLSRNGSVRDAGHFFPFRDCPGQSWTAGHPIVNVTEGHRHLGEKTRDAFAHAHKHYLADYDWFLKADDDTYVIMKNLHYFLSAQDHNSSVFFGQTFSLNIKQG